MREVCRDRGRGVRVTNDLTKNAKLFWNDGIREEFTRNIHYDSTVYYIGRVPSVVHTKYQLQGHLLFHLWDFRWLLYKHAYLGIFGPTVSGMSGMT